MKSKVSFVCQECGYESPRFLGKCPECGQWNSFRQIYHVQPKATNRSSDASVFDLKAKTISEVKGLDSQRIATGFSEMDMVLGGGVVKGSIILVSGDPGIGKSTLLLQIALDMANRDLPVLYISSEESEDQIAIRVARVGTLAKKKNLLLVSLVNSDAASDIIAGIKPKLVIIDSIQALESENAGGLSGSISQVRYAAFLFIRIAKGLGIPVIIVGHVTKEGMVAGPMMLSHMVDTVLFLEGEKFTNTRLLRSLKNRFGPIDEVGIFAMDEKGLSEVKNPEHLFLTDRINNASGSVLSATAEGTRIFLVEIQSLVVSTNMPIPRRVTAGFDSKRLELLLAVLQKHCRLPMSTMDVFVNVVGGLKLTDPGVDLAVCLSVFSSLKNQPLADTVAIAEVGLLGELRSVYAIDKRIKEAKKLGFIKIVSSKNYKTISEAIQQA